MTAEQDAMLEAAQEYVAEARNWQLQSERCLQEELKRGDAARIRLAKDLAALFRRDLYEAEKIFAAVWKSVDPATFREGP